MTTGVPAPPEPRRPPPRRWDRLRTALEAWSKSLDQVRVIIVAVGVIIAAMIALVTFIQSCTGIGPQPSSSPDASATASPTPVQPTPTSTVYSGNRLPRWVSATVGGANLDGSVLAPNEEVWLEELYPGAPPIQFSIHQVHDPALAEALGEQSAITAFGIVLSPPRAHSDIAWRLPIPPASSGQAAYRFRDELDNASGLLTVAGVATLSLDLTAAEDELPIVSVDALDGLSLDGAVAFQASAGLRMDLLVPWGTDERDLLAFVEDYALEVTGDAGAARAAVERFRGANEDALPLSPPDQWRFALEPGGMDGGTGDVVDFTMTGTVPRGGSTLMAIRVTDTADPRRTVVSRIFRLDVAPPPDTAPEAIIDQPPESADGQTFDVTDFDPDLGWYLAITLSAFVDDADEFLDNAAVTWTTDQTDLQPALLGTGRTVQAKLRSSCELVTHTITLRVMDSAGHESTATRRITVRVIC